MRLQNMSKEELLVTAQYFIENIEKCQKILADYLSPEGVSVLLTMDKLLEILDSETLIKFIKEVKES